MLNDTSSNNAHAAQHPLFPPLVAIFDELASTNAATVKATVVKLQYLVEEEADSLFHRSNAVNAQTKLLATFIESQLQKLLSRPENRIAGVHAVEVLRDVEFVEASLRLNLFHTMLTKIIVDPSIASREAARVWGLVMGSASGTASELVEQQLTKCLTDLVSGENLAGCKKFVGALVLQEVASRAAPQSILSKVDDIMRGLWGALKDAQDHTRTVAAGALRTLLDVVLHSGDASASEQLMDGILSQVIKCINQKHREIGHGGQLAFTAWLSAIVNSQRCVRVQEQRVREVFQLIVQQLQKPSSHADIRSETVKAIPLMAQYDRDRFTEICLVPFVSWSGTCYRSTSGPDERGQMFLAIGQLAGVLQDKVPLFIERVMSFTEGSLTSTLKPTKRDRCPEAVSCFAMIAAADPKTTRRYLRVVLAPLFACTPTVGFATDVASICKSFPELRSYCIDKLLEVTRVQFLQVKQRGALTSANEEDTKTLLNGLRVLSSLDCAGHSVLHFLTEMVLRFVQDPHEGVRREAIALCLKLVHSGCSAPGSPCKMDEQRGTLMHQGHQHIRLVLQVLRALINSAVADPESDIRLSTLEALTEAFDHTLSLQDCVRALFPALNDKHQNRMAAVRLLGRLGKRNPASVYTMLRRVLLQCITEIQYFSQDKKPEQSIWVLGAVVEAAPAMVRPYISALLKSSVERLRDKSQSQLVQTALLACIGSLVRFNQEADVSMLKDVRSIAVQHIMDSSCTPKKQEAIRTLCEIVRATRDISVYEQHPDLLRVLLNALHGGFKETWPLRQDVLRLIGIVGAVDPVKVKHFNRLDGAKMMLGGGESTSMVGHAGGGLRYRAEEAAAHTTVRALMNVIDLPSTHDEQCIQAIQALVLICTSRDMQLPSMISFFPKVIPAMIRHIHAHSKLREQLFRQLATLISVAKHHIRGHLDEVLQTVNQYVLGDDPDVLAQILLLLSELRRSLNEEFKPYLRVILPLLAFAAHEDTHRSAEKVFECFISFGKLMEGHLHLVLPCIVEIASSIGTPLHARLAAVVSITSFAKQLTSFADHAARCVHCLCPMLQAPLRSTGSAAEENERRHLSHAATTALLAIAQNLGPGFSKFSPIVRPIVAQRYGEGSQECNKFKQTVDQAILSGRTIVAEPPKPLDESARYGAPQNARRRDDNPTRFRAIRNHLLPVERTGEEEWKQWLRLFAIELLRSSPCNAHGFALPLAQIHEPFARELFHPAFAACYGEMDSTSRQEVVALLTTVLKNPRLPSEVLQELLNLSEYMERIEGGGSGTVGSSTVSSSPSTLLGSRGLRATGGLFDIATVIERSDKCSLHAKALHYLEVQFTDLTREYELGIARGRRAPLSKENWHQLLSAAEKSIYLCNLLGQRESANGILKYIQDNYSCLTGTGGDNGVQGGGFTVLDAELLEKLRWWSQSQKAFQERLKVDPTNVANMRGLLNAMDAQGEYTRLLEAYKAFSRRVGKKDAAQLAATGARAAWVLQAWDDMEQFTTNIVTEGYHGTTALFYNAVIAVHKKEFRKADGLILRCRRELDGSLAALVAESYDRAYELLVGNQQLCELEEIMMALRDPKSVPLWKELWEKRLGNMAYEGWQGTLATHSLVLPHTEELSMWIQFVTLCRSNGRERISMEVLHKLLGERRVADAVVSVEKPPKPLVALAALTHMYEVGKQSQALTLLKTYVDNVTRSDVAPGGVAQEDRADYAKCRARLGEWTAAQNVAVLCFNKALTDDVLQNLQLATELDPANGSTWHSWARMHHDIAVRGQHMFDATTLEQHVTCALDGYLRSIELQHHLQDVLGFLSLWFAYGTRPMVECSGVVDNVLQVNSNVWLRVLPQIIARIYTSNTTLNEQVYALLTTIAKAHPQALLYTLNVSSGSAVVTGVLSQEVVERRKAAQRVLVRIAELHHNGKQLVSEAALVCRELVRCAVLWTEMWFDELDRAWYCWGREKDPAVVWNIIEPLMKLLVKPESTMEQHFYLDFGVQLDAASSLIREAAAAVPGRGTRDVEEAWTQFKGIVDRLDQQINSMTSLAMQVVSPTLVRSGRNLLLAVPGQYRENLEYPRIAGFHGTLKVMSSKQHPRRISIFGSDGVTYKFLLKGHEDLRLDERVMQLLGLVNTVLEANQATNGKDCFVQTYSVTPLSDNAGLVGWVDHCDTMHQIVKDHRVHSKALSAELNAMRSYCDDLSRLTVIQHVEPFEYALETTEGNDLAKSLWIRAPSAEQWLDRRTTYVRTLGTMSMVGHILGLGDRHPSNLMLHSFTGRVVHIDLGDCFESAQTRSAFPERVPFRLTRMFVKAMEVGGIEGLFRHGCVSVMTVLREERNSLLSMLEAFLHDPLVSWWRDDNEEGEAQQNQREETAGLPPAQRTIHAATAVEGGGLNGGLNVGSVSSVVQPSLRRRTMASVRGAVLNQTQQTKKAQRVMTRITEKLNGKEFTSRDIERSASASREGLAVDDQVSRLIEEATSNENLCQHFPGWCPFW